MLKSYVIGLISSFLIAVICLLLFTFICVGNEDPRSLSGLFGVTSFVLGGVGGGLSAALLSREGTFPLSLGVSATYAVAVMIISQCKRTDMSRPVWQSALICIATVTLTVAVAMAVASKRGGVKSSRKKINRRIKIR